LVVFGASAAQTVDTHVGFLGGETTTAISRTLAREFAAEDAVTATPTGHRSVCITVLRTALAIADTMRTYSVRDDLPAWIRANERGDGPTALVMAATAGHPRRRQHAVTKRFIED